MGRNAEPARRFGALDDLGRDLRHALRGLRRSPGFAATVALVLALGIGANTAMFSIVYGVLLRPLPYPDAGAIVRIGDSFGPRSLSAMLLSNRSLPLLQELSESFEQLAAYEEISAEWDGAAGVTLRGARVSPSLFPLLRAAGCGPPPNRRTPRGRRSSDTRTTWGSGWRRTTRRRSAGTGRRPSRGTPSDRPCSERRTSTGTAWRRTRKWGFRWSRLGAVQGDVIGQTVLGEAYLLGGGMAQDDREAVHWFRAAAEQGGAIAQGRSSCR